jgi:hypothetical protein
MKSASQQRSASITTTTHVLQVATFRSKSGVAAQGATGSVKSVSNYNALGLWWDKGHLPPGPWIAPSITPHVLRSLKTGRPFSSATDSALKPSDDEPSKRIVGSGKLCPRPPSHDSKVSTPFATSVTTICLMPSSKGGSKLSSCARCKLSGSGLSGVLPGQWSHRFVSVLTYHPSAALVSGFNCPVTRRAILAHLCLCVKCTVIEPCEDFPAKRGISWGKYSTYV